MADSDDTSVLYGSNVYNSIIYSWYNKTGMKNFNGTDSEIVDVVSDYPWSIDSIKMSSAGGTIDIPHCYIVEYQQRYSSSITNLINSFVAAKNSSITSYGQITDVISKVSGLIKSLTNVGESQGGGNNGGNNSSGGNTPQQNAASDASSANTQSTQQNNSTQTNGTSGDGTQQQQASQSGQSAATPATAAETTTDSANSGPTTSNSDTAGSTTPTNASTSNSGSSSGNTTNSTSGNVKGADVNSSVTQISNQLKEFYENHIGSKISQITNPVKLQSTNGDKNKHFMQPYSLLYDLKPTGTRYNLPMISTPPVLSTRNSFGDGNGDDTSILSVNSFFSNIASLGSSISALSRDLTQINSFLSGEATGDLFERSHVEKAKFFQFPTDTDTYTVSFPLLNTVKNPNGTEPLWKKNYKFIMLFCMKNMIFRKDNVAYYPPLFYDLIIPGTIRLPYTYVESVDVQPLGMVRILSSGDKLFEFANANISIPVPEAWMVTIKFKSLIATSANLVLSSFADTPITT